MPSNGAENEAFSVEKELNLGEIPIAHGDCGCSTTDEAKHNLAMLSKNPMSPDLLVCSACGRCKPLDDDRRCPECGAIMCDLFAI